MFQSTRAHIIRTPFRAPAADAYAECWVRTVWHECLNKLFIRPMLRIGKPIGDACLANISPIAAPRARIRSLRSTCQSRVRLQHEPASSAVILMLGGIIHDYYRAA